MKANAIVIGLLLACGLCQGQAADDSKPASSNIMGQEYPRVHTDLRVTFHLKAPDAQKVQVRMGKTNRGSPVQSPPISNCNLMLFQGKRVSFFSRNDNSGILDPCSLTRMNCGLITILPSSRAILMSSPYMEIAKTPEMMTDLIYRHILAASWWNALRKHITAQNTGEQCFCLA
jgi:hypothetical protein